LEQSEESGKAFHFLGTRAAMARDPQEQKKLKAAMPAITTTRRPLRQAGMAMMPEHGEAKRSSGAEQQQRRWRKSAHLSTLWPAAAVVA
jgi:hypothetical protein